MSKKTTEKMTKAVHINLPPEMFIDLKEMHRSMANTEPFSSFIRIILGNYLAEYKNGKLQNKN